VVDVSGIGGEQGYGVIGEEVSGQVEHMVRTLEAVLAKLFALKTKAKVPTSLSLLSSPPHPGLNPPLFSVACPPLSGDGDS
jgi:hypothetical protein